jgi:uncharacterized protein (TIGR00299 family) protein
MAPPYYHGGETDRPPGEHEHEHGHNHGHDHEHEHDHGHGHHHHDDAVDDGPAEERDGLLEHGAGAGKVLFLDAFSGLAGDMLLSALLDLGVPRSAVTQGLAELDVGDYELRFVKRTRSSIAALGLDVVETGEQPARNYAQIRAMLEAAGSLTPGARSIAQRAFAVLAEAEARVHGTTPEHVHFHEVGAVDSIIDITASAIAVDFLGAETIICAPLPMGRGFIQSQHGRIPSPAPATLLCLQGVPTVDAGIERELVTPTGACLVKAIATGFSRWPTMRPERVGFGAGVMRLQDRPNVLRAVLGHPGTDAASAAASSHVVLEANVDDMTGEVAAWALERATRAGALDAWYTPIGMKKGRPALMLSALARRADVDAVARALLAETTSLGLRVRDAGRIERKRRMVEAQTEYGPIPVKVADGDGLPENVAPEYEACRAAAEAHGVPVKQVFAAAVAAYRANG